MADTNQQYDYYQTFYATASGRRVLADMEVLADQFKSDTPEQAYGKCCVLEFMQSLKLRCGLTPDKRADRIAMEAAIAMQTNDKPETKIDPLGV